MQIHAHNLGDSEIRTNRGQFPPTCSPQPSSQTIPPCFHKRKDNQPQISSPQSNSQMAFFNAPSSTPGLRTKRSSEVRTHKPPISKPEPRFHPRLSKDYYYKHRLLPFPKSSQQNSFTQSALILSSPTNLRSRSSQLLTNFQGIVQSAAGVSGSHMHHNQ